MMSYLKIYVCSIYISIKSRPKKIEEELLYGLFGFR